MANSTNLRTCTICLTPYISVVETKEDFLQHVRDEIAADSPEKRQARQDIAKQNTWLNRAEEMSDDIVKIEERVAAGR